MATTLRAGERVGPFEVLGALGAGGMGEVYRAWDPRLEREVALKVLPADVAGDPERLARFAREARLLAALDHPAIVRVHSLEEAAGVQVIAMELVDGESLDRLLPAGGLPIDRFLPLAIAVSDAVAAAHERGITHRDLKPGNLMLRPDGAVKVLDFGLAHRPSAVVAGRDHELPTEVLTREGTLLGTAPYMSPEQVRGLPADARSDVFALGATLYELLTGRRPFGGDDLASLASSILRDVPVPPTRARPDLPPALDVILARCLEKEPAARYPSAKDLHGDLARLAAELARAAGEAGSAPAADPPDRRRGRLLGASIAAVAVVSVAIALVPSWRSGDGSGGAAARIDSLAVLPLANLSGDAGQDYLADGLTEALIHDLASIGALKVISRTSVMRFKGTERPLPEVARELGVRGVVEGSVLVDAEQMRINVKLVDAARDETLWARRFDRPRKSVLALQAEVARAVADELRARLTPAESRRLAVEREIDPAAHELLLRGRYLWNRRTGESLKEALDAFERALAVQPDLAEAWAGIALVSVVRSAQGIGDDAPTETMARARSAARRALDLEPGLAEAYAALAYAEMLGDWDWDAAERDFARAVELNPGLSIAHFWRGAFLASQSRHDEALASVTRALAVDPISPLIGSGYAWVHHLAHRHDEAAAAAERVVGFEPNFWFAHSRLGFAHSLRGRHAEAIAAFRRAHELSGGSLDTLAFLGYALGSGGERRAAEEIARQLAVLAEDRYVSAFSRALVSLALGDRDAALAWLERAVEERSWYAPFFAVDPTLVPLRGEARFDEILHRIGLAHVASVS